MKVELKLIFCLLLAGQSLFAQAKVDIAITPQEGLEHLLNVELFFESSQGSRYQLEVSSDLKEWNESSILSFTPLSEGHHVGQIDTTNPYTPTAKYYRLNRLEWEFLPVFQSNDWIGDLSIAPNGDKACFVFQNRVTNTLYYAELYSNGELSIPVTVATTGVEDESGHWDNSGFANISLHLAGDTPVIICLSDTEQRILCFKQRTDTTWEKFYVTDVLDAHFWSNPVSCVDASGNIAVGYLAHGIGVYACWADVENLGNWNSTKLSDDPAPYQRNTSIAFAGNGDLLVRFGASYRLEFEAPVTVNPAYIPGALQKSISNTSTLLALERGRDDLRIYTSADNGENWDFEYSTIDGAEIVSGLINLDGRLSLFGAGVLHTRDLEEPIWHSVRIGNNDTNSNHTQLDTGQTAILLLTTEGELLLSLSEL